MRLPVSSRGKAAFTLLEMVIVISIIALLVALALPTAANLLQATRLNTAGSKVAGLCASARQLAMSKNTLSALVLLGAHGGPDDYRAFTLMEYDAIHGWQHNREWELLPQGVVVDAGNLDESSFLGAPFDLPFLSGQPPLRYHGKQVAAAACHARVFIPNGGLMDSETPSKIRLVEGEPRQNGVAYTGALNHGRPANWHDVAIIGATGLLKTNRP